MEPEAMAESEAVNEVLDDQEVWEDLLRCDSDPTDPKVEESLVELERQVRDLITLGVPRKKVWAEVQRNYGYRVFLRRAAGALWGRASNQLRPVLSLEDIPSEMTLLLMRRNQGDGRFPWEPREKFSHWLSKILQRAGLDVLRSFAPRKFVLPLGEVGRGLPEMTAKESRVEGAIKVLDEPHQTILWKWLIEKEQQKTIAKELGFSQAWVSDRINEGKQMLREVLGL